MSTLQQMLPTMKSFITFPLIFRAQQSLAQDTAPLLKAKAVIPTSFGQIGVNEVTDLAIDLV